MNYLYLAQMQHFREDAGSLQEAQIQHLQEQAAGPSRASRADSDYVSDSSTDEYEDDYCWCDAILASLVSMMLVKIDIRQDLA